MECIQDLPLVSVPVITYNSSKTVVETLDSIYAQTYPNIELIVSDDCSQDKTVEIVCEWIDKHKDRFVRTELITTERNTGTSANLNRAEAVCQGEWIKSIAGDDLLVDDCVESCIDYVNSHDDVIVLFGRMNAFGADEERCKQSNAVFDYDMLQETAEKQLHKLIFERNYIPAPTLFYHKERMRATGVRNDEHIPFLEDWPKWINLLRAGVQFHFIDKVLVKYRLGGISGNPGYNPRMYESERRLLFLYQYPIWYKENPHEAINKIVKEELEMYKSAYQAYTSYTNVLQSHAYRLGHTLLAPFKWLKSIL